jgi:hypothetical protein
MYLVRVCLGYLCLEKSGPTQLRDNSNTIVCVEVGRWVYVHAESIFLESANVHFGVTMVLTMKYFSLLP